MKCIEPNTVKDGMSAPVRAVKRGSDVIVSAVALLMLLPVFMVVAVAIWADDRGPVFFRQERIGRGGRAFWIYKFRSMRLDAESEGPALYNPDRDDRTTRVGGWIRAHHLDELPQLWNVLRGDMSLIGHRPERQYYIDQIMAEDPRYRSLYQIRPGVTSYATLYNGYTDTMQKMLRRLELDLYYLEHRSLGLDLRILWLTICSVISGKQF